MTNSGGCDLEKEFVGCEIYILKLFGKVGLMHDAAVGARRRFAHFICFVV